MPRRNSRATRARAAVFIFSITLLSQTLMAETADQASVRGYLEIRPVQYLHQGMPDYAVWSRAHLDWEKRLSPGWIARASGAVDLDSRGDVSRTRLYDDDERNLNRSLITAREFSLTWSGEQFDLAAGRMTIPWGRTDGFNPTDNLTPRDFLDPLESRRLATWALRGRNFIGPVTLESVFLPFPTMSRLPAAHDRWLLLPQTFGTAQIVYVGDRSEYPDRTLQNSAWAFKADYKQGAVEWSVSRYDGWEDQPVLLLSVPLIPPLAPPGPGVLPATIVRRFSPLTVTGGDLALIRGSFIFRAEAARHQRQGIYAARFDFYVVEGEWALGDWRMVLAMARIHGNENLPTGTAQLEQEALPAMIVHVERTVPTGPGASVQVISNLDGEGILGRAEFTWPAGAASRAAVGVDFISGPSGTFLGAWAGNDRVWASWRWFF